jgi:hypothetical protein
MIVCAWCRKALIGKDHDDAAIHTSCKGCLQVHTVCDRCLANLLQSLDAETVARLMAADNAARHSLPYATRSAKQDRPAHNDRHARRHESEQALSLQRG